jgi:hypothetical protein
LSFLKGNRTKRFKYFSILEILSPLFAQERLQVNFLRRLEESPRVSYSLSNYIIFKMENKKTTVEIDGCIINNIYSGFVERVYYAGMPSKDVFSIIFESSNVKENPDYNGISSHDRASSIWEVEEQRQLFFPVDYDKEISFPSRTSCKFKVEKVSPRELTAIITKE